MSSATNITQLITELGRVRAANAAAQGQIWGNAVSSLGQIPANVVAAKRQADDEAMRQRLASSELALRGQQSQLTQQQIESGTRAAQDVKTVDQVWTDPSVYNPDGTINRKGLLDKLTAANAGHLAPAVLEHADKLDASRAELLQRAQSLRESQRETLAREALRIEAAGNDPGMFGLTVATLSRPDIGIIPKPQADQYLQAQTPEQVASVLKTWKAGSKAGEPKLEKLGKGESLIQTEPGQPPKTLIQAGPDPAEAERQRHNKEMERISALNVGREQAAQAETVRHNKEMEKAANPLAMLTGGQGAVSSTAQAEGLHGEDFLKTLPPSVASEVKAYAEGRRPFPGGFALKAPYFQALIQAVGQYDPTFDAVNYNARSKTRADFTSGASSKTINALNTVTQHLNVLSDAADGLNNSSLPAYNSIANLVSKATGNPQVTRFETAKKAVTDELTRAWRQAGGSEQDIKSWSQVLDASESPAQLHGAIAQMGTLLEGKLSALEAQYQQGMGTSDTTGMKVVTPQSRAVLDKIEQRAGGPSQAGPREGDTKPIPGFPGTEQTFKNGKWIRTK